MISVTLEGAKDGIEAMLGAVLGACLEHALTFAVCFLSTRNLFRIMHFRFISSLAGSRRNIHI